MTPMGDETKRRELDHDGCEDFTVMMGALA